MILIILSWIYILFTTINFGFVFDRILVLKNKDFVITSFLGLFSVTILASIWAIFGRINVEFHIFLLVSNLLIYWKFKKNIGDIYKNLFLVIGNLGKFLKYYLAIVTILILAQCSTAPYIIDNETYYIQTIKWLNEYGFVKGLVNLHLFLGQTSGWHITQSVFNFSFLYGNFNDLSGFCLMLGMLFSITKFNSYFVEKKSFNFLLVGLLPFASIFYFQFISAPSPDMPVYVLTFFILFLFLENFKNCSQGKFTIITTLVLYLLYIKYSTLPFVLIPVILLIENFKVLSTAVWKASILSVTILLLFIVKNLIITGHPLFPLKIFRFISLDYAFPSVIENYYFNYLRHYGYLLNSEDYNSLSNFKLFEHWLNLPKLRGLLHKFIILLILIVPAFIFKFQNSKKYWLLYGLMVIQLILLFITSPQFRFFMNFMIFFSTFCFICMVRNEKIIKLILIISILPVFLMLFIPLNLIRFTDNKLMMKTHTLSFRNIIMPSEITDRSTHFKIIRLGNLLYYSPVNKDLLWITGDGALPCVSEEQVKMHRRMFKITPQMRTEDLKDGFYSKSVALDN